MISHYGWNSCGPDNPDTQLQAITSYMPISKTAWKGPHTHTHTHTHTCKRTLFYRGRLNKNDMCVYNLLFAPLCRQGVCVDRWMSLSLLILNTCACAHKTHTHSTVNCSKCAVTGTEGMGDRHKEEKTGKGEGWRQVWRKFKPSSLFVNVCVCVCVCVCEWDRHDEIYCKCTRGQNAWQSCLTLHDVSLKLNQ